MRKEKSYLLDEIKEKIEGSKSFILTSYKNVTPEESWSLRENLSKNSAEMEVVKKRILLKALKGFGIDCELPELTGHVAVVFTNEDPTETIKTVYEFSKTSEKLKVIKGQIEGKKMAEEELNFLSTLPSLPELRAQFVGLIQAPMANLLSVFESFLEKTDSVKEEKN